LPVAPAVYTPVDYGYPDDGVLAIGELNRPQWVYADIDFLSMNDMQQDEPPAWLHFFKELLNARRRASAALPAGCGDSVATAADVGGIVQNAQWDPLWSAFAIVRKVSV